ncbi:hypothetical protein N3K66_002194 [Trichothecium roseum]|uniref:Uncharacterized protein n=1 Tax=Trichothecium roseum TaxID=47278 RepID=A0ACC0VAC2_9HYPO|nr:hypothetical protein N3K66_002194 [Trichothecium roseum]
MAEYSSLKVPELKKLLGERGLSQAGVKADLIARLQEHDKSPAEEKLTEKSKAEGKEDEITYSDDEATTSKLAPVEEAAAAPQPSADAEVSAEELKADTEPAAAEEEEKKKAEEAAPAANYALGLSSTEAEAEAKKRADRAKRFGIEEDEDAKKRAERAERFGIDEKDLAKGLDSALPERPLKRGRGRNAGEDGGRPNKRQSLDRRGGGRRNRGNRGDRGGRQQNGGGKTDAPRKAGIMDDPAEKAKAEARKARFAAA